MKSDKPIKPVKSGANPAGYFIYSLRVPPDIWRAIPGFVDYEFRAELTDEGILYRAAAKVRPVDDWPGTNGDGA